MPLTALADSTASVNAPVDSAAGLRLVALAPDAAKLARLRRLVTPGARVRITTGTRTEPLLVRAVTTAGIEGRRLVRPPDGDERAESTIVVAWPAIRALERRTRSWGRGALVGTGVGAGIGAAPGIGLLAVSNDVGGGILGEFLGVAGIQAAITLGAIGAASGLVVGTLVGGSITSWPGLYRAPEVRVRDDVAVHRIALGDLEVDDHRASKRARQTIATALRGAGFEVVDVDPRARKKGVAADTAAGRAEVDLTGAVHTRGPLAVRCDFRVTRHGTQELVATARFGSGPPPSRWSVTPIGWNSQDLRKLVTTALSPLGALQATAPAPAPDHGD